MSVGNGVESTYSDFFQTIFDIGERKKPESCEASRMLLDVACHFSVDSPCKLGGSGPLKEINPRRPNAHYRVVITEGISVLDVGVDVPFWGEESVDNWLCP